MRQILKKKSTKTKYFLRYWVSTLLVIATAFVALEVTRTDFSKFFMANKLVFSFIGIGFITYVLGIIATAHMIKKQIKIRLKQKLRLISVYLLAIVVGMYITFAYKSFISYEEIVKVCIYLTPLVAGLITYFVFKEPPKANKEKEMNMEIGI